MRLVVSAPKSYAAERTYILDVVLREWLGLDFEISSEVAECVAIRVAGDPLGRQLTVRDVLFAVPQQDWLTERSMPVTPLTQVATPWPIPVLFGQPATNGTLWNQTADGLALTVDIFGTAFFLLTRYEEVVRRTRDRHGRFPATASLAAAEGFLGRPIVDEYVDLLWLAVQELWPQLERRPSTFRLRPTHDVDFASASFGVPARTVARAVARDVIRQHDVGLAVRRTGSFVAARAGRPAWDPFDTFDFLMDTSERHGLQSTFYIMAGTGAAPLDGNYRPTDPHVSRVLRRINERGHEVGLHASYDSYRSVELMAAELETLRSACRAVGFDQPAWGVRQHFLRFENPETWRDQESIGLEHDSTLGFADQVGFRAGTCREFPIFDLTERRTMRLRERPLVLMDGTLFSYLHLGLDESAARARAIVDSCRRQRGDAVLLYHNSSLTGPRQRAHYRDLIEESARPD